ncbi:Mur ligase [Halteromyces radiatus]|uniref:Mur ligase n=1 Tax=Halteromyces radiatus TaxID=101107 RepID=UPI00221F1ECE|nr:Mur ligase [Halteromyces radiatus]KAI8089597.1 Mur ligase [Halteromyces radiatus]
MEFGLERMQKLLCHLGNPQDQVKVIHVAGTNGKGSVCAYMTSVLLQAGYKVGRFNSPHLIAPHDSIQINGKPVDPNVFETTMERTRKISQDTLVNATSFEVLVGTALWLFVHPPEEENGLDFIVVEVGLGGLLDATNVFRSPIMTIITSIGMDHMGILGNTIAEIARAKAGIMKPGCPVVIAPQSEQQAETSLVHYARELDISCVVMVPAIADDDITTIVTTGEQHLHLQLEPKDVIKGSTLPPLDIHYTVELQGDYQRENSATAIMALKWLAHSGHIRLDTTTLQQGMTRTSWPGRLDWVNTTCLLPHLPFTTLLVDGAHNPPACQELRRYIDSILQQQQRTRVIWLIGITKGKSVSDMLQVLTHQDDLILTVPFSQPQDMSWIECVDPVDLAQHVNDYYDDSNEQSRTKALPQQSLSDALTMAGSLFRPDSDLVVLCGSLYLVADLYRLMDIHPFS